MFFVRAILQSRKTKPTKARGDSKLPIQPGALDGMGRIFKLKGLICTRS